jgi:hypothetical protein
MLVSQSVTSFDHDQGSTTVVSPFAFATRGRARDRVRISMGGRRSRKADKADKEQYWHLHAYIEAGAALAAWESP